MTTLTGLNRVADPISSEQLASNLTASIGKTVDGAEITPTSINVWGATISEADRTAIQNSINSYKYTAPPVATHGHDSSYVALNDPRLTDSRTPLAHAHAQTDVTNLGTALAGKSDTTHTHAAPAPVYALLANGATAMAFGTNDTVKVTPTATATYTTTVPAAGKTKQLIVLTSGVVSFTITFGTGFKPTATLVTGTTASRVFVVSWVSDGTNLYEAGRTVAMVA